VKAIRPNFILLLSVLTLFCVGDLIAEINEAKIKRITENLQEYRRDWTVQDTRSLLNGASGHAMQFTSIVGDDGKEVKITISADTVLVAGKDISGNLGSKTTFGANSPIIEDVRNSQIATGEKSSVSTPRNTNYSINISLSIALTVSIALNAYLLNRTRKRAGSRGSSRTKPTV
jgi:hypothetical protein